MSRGPRNKSKPSFLWMMERCGWARKPGQEFVLAVRITRAGWEEALSHAVLTSYEPGIYPSREDWQSQMDRALVHVQWDPERTIHGKSLPERAIQVGLSRHIIARYVDEWANEITDMTPLVRKMYALIQAGQSDRAKGLLPKERIYPLDPQIGKRIGLSS